MRRTILELLFVLALMLIALLAPASGQDVRITLKDDTVISFDDAGQFGPLEVRKLYGTLLILNLDKTYREGGEPVFFKRFESKGALPFPDSVAGDDGWQIQIPETQRPRQVPGLEDSRKYHMVWPGEAIAVFEAGANLFPKPSHTVTTFIRSVSTSEMDFDCFAADRFTAAIRQYGDEMPLDEADVHRRWNIFFGGPAPQGWHEKVQPREDGYSNGHYDSLHWAVLKFLLLGERDEDWAHVVRRAVAHVTAGLVWSPNSAYYGMARYEKSGDSPSWGPGVVGGVNFNPSWAKTWVRGHVLVAALLPRNELINDALELRFARLRTQDPRQVWPDGRWGARIKARYLDDLYAAFMKTRDPIFAANAAVGIDHAMSLVDADGYWINPGAQPPEASSPWLNAELAAVIGRWIRQGVGTQHLAQLLDVMEVIWRKGTIPHESAPLVRKVRYRFGDAPGHPSTMGYVIPMMRFLAFYREGWEGDYRANLNWFLKNGDRGFGQPTRPVHYRDATGGSARNKQLLQYLWAGVR